jgi:phenylpropionate dioxygenase-like ring-hydroxylating dioxygenase large terminal subunit
MRMDNVSTSWNSRIGSKGGQLTYVPKDSRLPLVPGVREEDFGAQAYFYYLLPATYLAARPHSFTAFNALPDGVSACKINMDFFFPDPSSTDPAYMDQLYDFQDAIVFREDGPMQETVQRGLTSFRGDGRLSVRWEHGIHYLHNWILDHVAGSSR